MLNVSFVKELHLKQDACINETKDIKDTTMCLETLEKTLRSIAEIRQYCI